MARRKARFRISIKDNLTNHTHKIKLFQAGGARFLVRQNDQRAQRVPYATLTKVFARLQQWMVKEVKRSYRQAA